jgi:hypothetical protein
MKIAFALMDIAIVIAFLNAPAVLDWIEHRWRCSAMALA